MSRHHDARTGQGISLLIFLAAMFFSWWTADASATASPTSRPSAGTVLFIDAAVKNPELLLAGLKPDVSVIRLQHGQDGVQQIAEALKPYL